MSPLFKIRQEPLSYFWTQVFIAYWKRTQNKHTIQSFILPKQNNTVFILSNECQQHTTLLKRYSLCQHGSISYKSSNYGLRKQTFKECLKDIFKRWLYNLSCTVKADLKYFCLLEEVSLEKTSGHIALLWSDSEPPFAVLRWSKLRRLLAVAFPQGDMIGPRNNVYYKVASHFLWREKEEKIPLNMQGYK